LPAVNKRGYASQASITNARKSKKDKISLPLRGHNLYIGDRVRDFWMHGETLKAINAQQETVTAM